MEFISKSDRETKKLAEVLAKEMAKRPVRRKGGVVIGLEGELGAGKTVFVKGFARGLGLKDKITSPTFVLLKSYKVKRGNFRQMIHIDAYRLKDHHDLIGLGVKELINDPNSVILIEWSERVKKILPKNYLRVHLDHLDKKTRKITVRKK